MATRKSPATTQVGTVKAPAAPKGGARSEVVKKPARAPVETAAPAAKSPAAKSPAAKSPAAKSPAAKSPAPEAPATRPRKLVPKAPQRPAPDRIVMVAQAAYYRAERRGFAPGGEMDDWLAAEEEIARLLAAR